MPEKMPTYRVDESALRAKLLGYQVEVNAAECSAIENEVAALRYKKTIALPPVNLKVVVPALAVTLLAAVIYFNIDSIKDLFSPAPEVKIENKVVQPVKQTPVTPPATVAVTPVATPTLAVQPPSQAEVAKKQDSVAAAKKEDTAKQEALKKPNPVIAQPPSDSAIKKNTVSKQDTAVQKTEAPVKKKKKRRRRNSANMDDLKQSTLESNGADDDVVVPQ